MAGTARRVALLVVCVANAAATPVSCASVAFSEKVVTTLAGGARAVFAVDLDDDGDVDVLAAEYDDNTVAWYENDGSESFTELIITAHATEAYSVFAIDVDGDGDVDALSASFAIDVDGDGDVDALAAVWDENAVAWYENDCGTHAPTASFVPTAQPSSGPSLVQRPAAATTCERFRPGGRRNVGIVARGRSRPDVRADARPLRRRNLLGGPHGIVVQLVRAGYVLQRHGRVRVRHLPREHVR